MSPIEVTYSKLSIGVESKKIIIMIKQHFHILGSHMHLMPLLRLLYSIILSMSPVAFIGDWSLIKTANIGRDPKLQGFSAAWEYLSYGPEGPVKLLQLSFSAVMAHDEIKKAFGMHILWVNSSMIPWVLLKTYTISGAVLSSRFNWLGSEQFQEITSCDNMRKMPCHLLEIECFTISQFLM